MNMQKTINKANNLSAMVAYIRGIRDMSELFARAGVRVDDVQTAADEVHVDDIYMTSDHILPGKVCDKIRDIALQIASDRQEAVARR